MKKLSKLFSVLLALTMALALAAPAFASEEKTGSITVKNTATDETYTAYKIFDLTYTENKDAHSYSISSDSEWLKVVQAYIAQGDKGITLTASADGTKYVVAIEDSVFSAADFAEYLYDNKDGKNGTSLSISNGVASVSGLPLGYYFVTSSVGSLANLTNTEPNAEIYDKNDKPTVDKAQSKTEDGTYSSDTFDVKIGDTVYYQITGKVPSTTGYKTYTYEISDVLSDGLTLKADTISIKIGDVDFSNNKNVTLDTTVNSDDNGATDEFKITFDMKELQDYVGQTITVTYQATVNENAVADVEENHVTLEYSNDPNNSDTATNEKKTYVYDAKIVIDKYATNSNDANDTSTKLEGAEFVLKNENGDYYKYTEATNTPAKVDWVDDVDDATVAVTDSNGATDDFVGLEAGTYYLVETKAPEGYNLLTYEIKVVIAGGTADATTGVPSAATVTYYDEDGTTGIAANNSIVPVANNAGTILPSTGGMGTTIFYVIGGLLVIGAGIALITKKRMSAKN